MAKYGSKGCMTGQDALKSSWRNKKSDVGKVKIPAGAGAPSTKGSIKYPKQVGK